MQKLIIISGPTGVGKTNISIELAKRINGAIISADSIQVYKGLDIGSAKITRQEMQGIDHYLIDCLNPDENFGVDVFVKLANQAIEKIAYEEKMPIIVGGTAFYIQALIKGVDFTQETEKDKTYRNELSLLDEDTLYEMLVKIDPQYALSVHKNNKKRVIRALEYFHNTGIMFSEYNKLQENRPAKFDYKYYVLNDDRKKLYERCDIRVDKMMEMGLLEEAKWLYELGLPREATSMQGIGYRELIEYFDGVISYDEAVEKIKKNTRHYVKRQLTWFTRESNISFCDKSIMSDEQILNNIIADIKNNS